MKLHYFAMPSHPPERPLKDGHEWDLQVDEPHLRTV
jgi:hypothetical protein